MSYDLGDCAKWEYMFPTNEKPVLLLPDEDIDMDFEDEAVSYQFFKMHFDDFYFILYKNLKKDYFAEF